jgi:hypothetical protein
VSVGDVLRFPERRAVVTMLVLCAGGLAGLAAVVFDVSHLHALTAAGAFGGKGGAIAGIQTFADKIKGNLIWLVSVVSGVAVVAIGAMFLTGHSRAQDYALKAGVGFLVIAGAGGIVA